jgi:hypothetical protein
MNQHREPQAGEVYRDSNGIIREVDFLYSVRVPSTGKQQIQVKYSVPTRLGSVRFSCTLAEWQEWAAGAKMTAEGFTK